MLLTKRVNKQIDNTLISEQFNSMDSVNMS